MKRILFVVLALGLFVFGAPSASGHNEHGSGSFEGNVSVTCTPSHYNNDDPIVFPGQVGVSHRHQFFGSTTANANSTYNQMVQSTTTCNYEGDTAGYWFPALQRPDGTNVVPFQHYAYYRASNNWDRSLTVPPAGFKMVSGQPFGDPSYKRYWRCNSGGTFTDGLTTPDCPLTSSLDAISMVVSFPQCWDGVNKWLPNNAHMEFANEGTTKSCPASHPKRIFELAVFAVWNDTQGENLNFKSKGYRLSSDQSGQVTGTSLHSDFWNTWNQAEFERIMQSCLVDHIDVPESTADPNCLQIKGAATQPPPLEGEPSPSPTSPPIPVVTVSPGTTEIRCTDGSVPSVTSSSPLRINC